MKSVSLEQPALLKALIYGDSGTGKTTLVGSAMEHPATRPVLVLNSRGQPISLRRYDPPPLVVGIEKFADFNVPYEWFANGQSRGWKQPSQAHKDFTEVVAAYLDRWGFDHFNTVVVDSITHAQGRCIQAATGQTDLKPGNKPKRTEIQHWGDVLSMMVNLTDKYYGLDVNVLMTALQTRREFEDLGYTWYSPMLQGRSDMAVPANAELVGRLVIAEQLSRRQREDLGLPEPKRNRAQAGPGHFNVLLTRGGRDFMAKWQGVIDAPHSVPSPTIGKLMEVLMK